MAKLVLTKDFEKKKRSRRGRTSRAKGASYERSIAKRFQERYGIELVRTPQSGGFAKNKVSAEGFRGDIVPADKNVSLKIHVECKDCKTWSVHKWLEQAEGDCPEGKVPMVVAHKFGTSKSYVILPVEGFFDLVSEIGG